jgi:hypothetical protein
MKRFPLVLACVAMLAAGVLAAQGMASGTAAADTTTTATTATTATTTETETDSGSTHVAVQLCHVTGSKKHGNLKFHTITVDQHAVAALLKHGDTQGACAASAAASTTSVGHGKGHGK